MTRDRLWTWLSLLILATAAQPLDLAAAEPLDEIVAVVDEDVVTRSELDQEVNRIRVQLRARGTTGMPPREVLERQVLDRVIMRKLELAAAKRAGIEVGEGEVAQAVNGIARKAGLTLSEFREALQQEGMDLRSFREGIRKQMIIQRLLQKEVTQRIRVTDQEVKNFLARKPAGPTGRSEYHLRHILIATPEGASPEQLEQARKKAERLVQELRNGLDFATAALTESDSQQALEGGDLGWRRTDQLPTLFVDRVATMERGEISDPIRSASGYNIIKVEDYKGGDRMIVEQTRVRHILIKTSEVTSDEDARTRLEQLRQRIEGGDDFADLARANSEDTASAIKGGDLGWVSAGDLLPRFEEEMNRLEIGELSEPIRTEFGWHLLQVLDRRSYDSTEEVKKAEARDKIRKRKFEEESELYLRRLRDEAFIEKKLDSG
ncbi:MAG TPA: molecular chaperone SurA [Sedimenticola thiotaurini]|uniref:Chaperone SurA n=1 Tax=Sedimenticola thiotaurini TaxID=1543721 RepID=A0A831RMB7_9GAMM|nr:molecular chaperone SurA [Sedimenticola thiotaurini]